MMNEICIQMNGLRFKGRDSENMKKRNFFAYKDNFAINKLVRSNLVFGNLLTSNPLVSITIPTFKRPELLQEAVESVLKQRDFSDFEIVIVDNDSEGLYTDKIIKFLSALNDERIRYYINEHNIGVFGNWNRCIELAHGKWMTILCDDDLLFNNYLSVLTQELEQDKSLNRVECRYQIFSDSQQIKATPKQLRSYNLSCRFLGEQCNVRYDMYLFGCYTAPHTQLYKRELALELGGFYPDYAPISDYVFNAMYLYNYPGGVFINQYLCGYRWSVNESQRKIVKVGVCRWSRVFRVYLLAKNNTVVRRVISSFLNYEELFALTGKKNIFQKILFSAFNRLLVIYEWIIKIPKQIV